MGRKARNTTTLLVFAGIMLLTAFAWAASSAAVEDAAANRFDREVLKVEAAIRARWDAQEQVLRSAAALLEVQPDTTREEWAAYVDELQLDINYPGIQGVGLTIVVPYEEREAHEAEMLRQLRPYGFENYSIHPVPGFEHQPEYLTAIIYLDPLDERNRRAIGVDMYAEDNRRGAMSRARDTGMPSLSGKILLVQEITEDKQPGFLLYLPVYQGAPETIDERREAITGWVYSPFRAHDLMDRVLGRSDLEVTFELFDGSTTDPEAILYDEDPQIGPGDPIAVQRTEVRTLEIAGRPWTIRYAATPAFEAAAESIAPQVVLGSGVIIAFLLTGLVWTLARVTIRAEALALDITAELRERERQNAALTAELARSNEDLEQFAYVASHDLQEPVRTVQSYLGLLHAEAGERLDAESTDYLETARQGAARMRELIHDLLEYSRAGRAITEARPVDLNDIVDEAIQNTAASAQAVNAQVTRGADLPPVRGDHGGLVRVVVNLIANGLKYKREEPPRIHVDAERRGDRVRVTVADNGIGIRPEDTDKLFIMFSRLHPRDMYEGTGMGLAIARRTVELMGGEIGVESELGKGSTFWFELEAAV